MDSDSLADMKKIVKNLWVVVGIILGALMGFNGVVMADEMEMKVPETYIKAVNPG